MKKDETPTYESAQAELQQIVQALQDETLPIDQLASTISRANALIRFCRERLRAIEEEVGKLNSP
ncbi:MAG: exodeoxyribonuclease VII small subunit [Saprospiraceae bacterium]|nr:exodeoxyribonuclease VII small subunit [Saprospiraceae bacterium]